MKVAPQRSEYNCGRATSIPWKQRWKDRSSIVTVPHRTMLPVRCLQVHGNSPRKETRSAASRNWEAPMMAR